MRGFPGSILILMFALLLPASNAHAQSFGFPSLLNPEGSRLFPQLLTVPRHPGKPDPRWRSFHWKYMDRSAKGTPYRLYFYEEEQEWVARLTIPRVEEQVAYLTEVFKYSPSKEFSYVLFGSRQEFQQANIFFINEGVQGITSTTEPTMAIPWWGESQTFDHISLHEMVHQFQVQKINDLSENGMGVAGSATPLWFIEGMAEYYSLHGIDSETRMYIRDLVFHPSRDNPDAAAELPKLFSDGPFDFVHIYKLGQARIAFFEKEFGEGTAQRLLEAAARSISAEPVLFPNTVSLVLGQSPEEIEDKWQKYLRDTIVGKAEPQEQAIEEYQLIEAAGETLDAFDISPDGNLIATREVDPLSGITSIMLIDRKNKDRKIEVAHDHQADLIRLYFFEFPALSVSDHAIAYVVLTTAGPELEFRSLSRSKSGSIQLGSAQRIEIHRFGISQATSPALSPDGKRVAFAGLDADGQENVYVVPTREDVTSADVQKLTSDPYSWRQLEWNGEGILAASDKTPAGKYNLYLLPLDSQPPKRLTYSSAEQGFPSGSPDRLLFQSWSSGSPQVHVKQGSEEIQLTQARTGLTNPRFRHGNIYALGFKSGRFHLYRIPSDKMLRKVRLALPANPPAALDKPWEPKLASLSDLNVQPYKPFSSSGIRLDNLGGFFGTGSVGGASATVSDLMRNYSATGEFFILGDLDLTNTTFLLSSQKGRSTWTVGAYHTVQPRLDAVFEMDDITRTFLHREFGGVGAFQYPLGVYHYVDLGVRLAGVNRSDFSDDELETQWQAVNPGVEFMAAPTLRLGYDRILYELYTGPLEGYGLLLESETSYFPGRNSPNERLRMDAAYYLQVFGRTIIAIQGLAGASIGGTFRHPFFLSSDDIFRGYIFGDDRLRGNYVAGLKTEIRFPIGTFFGFPPLRGLVAYDHGTIFRRWGEARSGLASSITGGLALNFPPLAISLLASNPIQYAPGPIDRPVLHFTLRYLYL